MTRSSIALLSLFLLSFSTQACVATDGTNDDAEHTGSQASAIQNGTAVNPASTGMVMLTQGSRLCSATLLDNRFLLTAAHCVESYANRTFGGSGNINVGNNTGSARGVAVDSKGRVVVGVTVSSVSSENKIVLARFLADGTPDATFGDAGLCEQGTAGVAEVGDIAVDSRDRIVVASTITLNGNRQIATWRFTEAGVMDWDFGLVQVTDFASSPDEVAKAVRIDAINRIVVAAEAKTATGQPLIALVRYLPNGTLDTTFDGDGKVLTDLSAKGVSWTFGGMSIDAYSRTVIAGTAGTNIAVVRYNNNGSLDSTLSGDGVAYVRPTNMAMARAVSVASDAQNRIILTGSSTSSAPVSYALVGRLKSDGVPDTSFSGDGWVSYKHVWGNLVNTRVAVDAQGGIIATGVISGSRIGATRFTTTGSYDTKFGMGGVIDWLGSESTNPHAGAIAFDKSGGHMFIAGDMQLASAPSLPRVWSLTLDHDVVPGWSSFTATMGNQTAKAETVYRHGPLDVALVKLATPLSMNGDAAHFEFQGFWPESILSLKNRSLHCYGYGNSDDVRSTGSGTLRTGIVPVSSTGLLDYTLVPNAEGQIPVHGDSGGACFATDSTGSWRLTGVTSWGTGGSDPTAFTLHQVATPVFTDWVRSIRLR